MVANDLGVCRVVVALFGHPIQSQRRLPGQLVHLLGEAVQVPHVHSRELVEAASDRSHLVLRMTEMPLASHGSGVAAQATEQRWQRGNIRRQAYSRRAMVGK